jgi:hypothetical protein
MDPGHLSLLEFESAQHAITNLFLDGLPTVNRSCVHHDDRVLSLRL